MTVFSNCVSVSSKFNISFLHDGTKFCSVFSGYRIENLIRMPKMCLKQLFSFSKWVLQAILSLIVLSNCVSVSSNFDTTFVPGDIKFCNVFFMLLDRKFNEDFKNVLKTVIFSLQVGLTNNFISICKLCSKVAKIRV